MAEILPTITLSGAMPSAALMLGTAASAEMSQEVNAYMGSTYIGMPIDEIDNAFIRNITMPARQAIAIVQTAAVQMNLLDDFIQIETEEQLRYVPPCMQLSLVMYPPVRKLLEDGRISGFGFDPDRLPLEDAWGRLIENGCTGDLQQLKPDEHGNIHFDLEWTWRSDDPDADVHQIECVETLRATAQRVIEELAQDPTCMDNLIA